MCLAYPAKVVSKTADQGVVELAGNRYDVNLVLVPDVEIGQYVLVHAGYAIQIVDPHVAHETWEIFGEIDRSMGTTDERRRPSS